MKKLLSVFLSVFLSALVLPCAASEHGAGALHDTPFGIKGEQTEDGLTVRAVAQPSLIKAEECDFLGIMYLELGNEEIDIEDVSALRAAFSSYPGRIKICGDTELRLPWDKNMTVVAAPFYRINREPYYGDRLRLGHHFNRPWVFRNEDEDEDYAVPGAPAYYDSVGAEINAKYSGTLGSEILCYDLDYDLTVPADGKAAPFVAMYGVDGKLTGVKSLFGKTGTPVDSGKKTWLHLLPEESPAVCTSAQPVDCFRAYVWDENLRPLAASPRVSVTEAELSVELTEAGADVAITQEDVRTAVIYGPSKHIFGGRRYLKTLERRNISGEGKITLSEKGRYLAVLTDSRGVEYTRVIDSF